MRERERGLITIRVLVHASDLPPAGWLRQPGVAVGTRGTGLVTFVSSVFFVFFVSPVPRPHVGATVCNLGGSFLKYP